jgi:energy-coupling factor transporter ATP-binding protein EcfA2
VVGRPEVILADEPTGNLDPDLSREIFRLFERFHQVGVSLLIATHDLDLIQSLGHRTLVLSKGRLVADAIPQPASPEPASGQRLGAAGVSRDATLVETPRHLGSATIAAPPPIPWTGSSARPSPR